MQPKSHCDPYETNQKHESGEVIHEGKTVGICEVMVRARGPEVEQTLTKAIGTRFDIAIRGQSNQPQDRIRVIDSNYKKMGIAM